MQFLCNLPAAELLENFGISGKIWKLLILILRCSCGVVKFFQLPRSSYVPAFAAAAYLKIWEKSKFAYEVTSCESENLTKMKFRRTTSKINTRLK